jgi:CRP-like cAMP-binding protein
MSAADDLKRFALFNDLDEDERDDLAALLEERDLSPGETLFDAGDEADALLLVARGRVDLSQRGRGEKLAVGAGDWFGGLALFAVGSRGVDAAGAERSELWLLRREDFLRFAEDHPRAAFRIAAALMTDVAQHARAALGSVDPAGTRD